MVHKAASSNMKFYTGYIQAVQLLELDGTLWYFMGSQHNPVERKPVEPKGETQKTSCHVSAMHRNMSGKDGINGMALSPDGRLYVFGADGVIDRVNVQTASVEMSVDINSLYRFDSRGLVHYGVSGLAVSFDGAWIACVSDLDEPSRPLLILNADTLQKQKDFSLEGGGPCAVGFLPDGHLLVNQRERGLSIWDMEHGFVKTIYDEAGMIDFRVLSDGNILTCDAENRLRLLDKFGMTIRVLAQIQGEYRGMTASKTGMAAVCFDCVYLLDTHTVGCVRTVPGRMASFTEDGHYLITNEEIVYALETGERAEYLLCAVRSFAETDTLNSLFRAAIQAGHEALARMDLAEAQTRLSVAREIKGDDAQCIRLNDAIGAYGLRTGIRAIYPVNAEIQHTHSISCLCMNHAGDAIACLSGTNQITLYTRVGTQIKHFRDIDAELQQISFSENDLSLICIGSYTALLLNVATGEVKELPDKFVYLTTDLNYGLMQDEDDGSFSLHALADGSVLCSFYGLGKQLLGAAEQNGQLHLFFSGRVGATGSFIGHAAVVDLSEPRTSKRYCFTEGTDAGVKASYALHNLYCVDKAGRYWGATLYKNRPAVLDRIQFAQYGEILYPTDTALVAKFEKNPAGITGMRFSGDDDFLCVADESGTLKLLGLYCDCVRELNAHSGRINSLATDGSLIATGGRDGQVKLWNIEWEYTQSV